MQMPSPDEIIFREEQRPWAGFIILGMISCAVAVVIFIYAMVLHRPFGDRPMSDAGLVIVGLAVSSHRWRG